MSPGRDVQPLQLRAPAEEGSDDAASPAQMLCSMNAAKPSLL